jgi:hypothetical protein
MRDLQLRLDELRFDELAEIGRSLIAPRAPQWTDHNVHDPGIMLTELVAWIAEAQSYALGRSRRDERFAYAQLMGLRASGPQPSTGLIWPDVNAMTDPAMPLPWVRGTVIGPANDVFAEDNGSPVFHPLQEIYLTSSRLVSVRSIAEDGAMTDLTRVNEHGGTSFLPFGNSPSRHTRLELAFSGADGAPTIAPSETVLLSIGFELSRADVTSSAPTRRTALRATFIDAEGEEQPLPIVSDGTAMFTRSGVMLLRVSPAAMSIDGTFTLRIDCPSGAWLVTPRVLRILPNVIPVAQSERRESADVGAALGVPDEEIALFETGSEIELHPIALQFTDPLTAVEVSTLEEGGTQKWIAVESFDASGPEDRHVFVDVERARLQFGNGVNGRIPGAGAAIQASYTVCSGSAGNLSAELEWRVGGTVGVFGMNPSLMSGGRDALTPGDLQVAARDRLENQRPIVSTSQLERAALEAWDLGVVRAHELLPQENGQPVPGSRRLLLVGTHEHEDAALDTLESDAWREAIRARLAPRLTLGQRLTIVRPRYTTVGLRATLQIKPKIAPADVQKRVLAELRKRFALIDEQGRVAWPLGRNITKLAISGWLRKLEGVARVIDVTLVENGTVTTSPQIKLGRTGLPLFREAATDVRILRDGERSEP